MITLPSFTFQPVKLAAAVAELRRRLPALRRERLPEPRQVEEAAALLERLEATPAEEVPRFAAGLMTRELWVLALALTDIEQEELAQKCAAVLRLRWKPAFSHGLWKGLQRRPRHGHAAQLLHAALAAGEDEFFQGRPERLPDIEAALGAPDLVAALGARLAQGMDPFAQQARELDLKPEGELWRAVRAACLLQGERTTYGREPAEELWAALDALREAEFVRAVDRYLQQVPPDEWAEVVMLGVLERLGPPQRNGVLNARWDPVSEASREAFRQWWIRREVERFFRHDNERHRFWMKYIPDMREVYSAPEAEALILLFPRLVVVEFANTGNAAYLYEPDAFTARFGPPAQAAAAAYRPDRLKDREACVERILHGGAWQWRAEEILEWYL